MGVYDNLKYEKHLPILNKLDIIMRILDKYNLDKLEQCFNGFSQIFEEFYKIKDK